MFIRLLGIFAMLVFIVSIDHAAYASCSTYRCPNEYSNAD